MAARGKKKVFEDLISVPPVDSVRDWVLLGLDPSLSRTGFAIAYQTPQSFEWIRIGSLKPDDASLPVWLRSTMIARALEELLFGTHNPEWEPVGLMICMEVPTPHNDFLNSLSKIIHSHLLPHTAPYAQVRVLLVNANTMRSNMQLKATGDNKWENIRRAQDFADPTLYPGIDSDACDAILFAQYGRHVATLLTGGDVDSVPRPILLSLCDTTNVQKGKGRRARTVTKGLLHNPAYWYRYEKSAYQISLKDARVPPKQRLQKLSITI